MKGLTARLMRIQRFSIDQMLRMHRAELEQDKKFRAFIADPKSTGSSPFDYWAVGMIFMNQYDRDLGNYWDRGKPESEKDVEISRFEKSLLPIVSRNGARDLNDTPEVSDMHRIDDEVLLRGYKVNTAKGQSANGRGINAFIEEVPF